jgi:hypothetical protein
MSSVRSDLFRFGSGRKRATRNEWDALSEKAKIFDTRDFCSLRRNMTRTDFRLTFFLVRL